jgi:hypothetical protein
MARVRLGSLAIFAVFTAYVGTARADGDAARVHFDEGKRLRDAGDCEHAIPAFTKSVAAEKSIGGYYNLGYCHEQRGARQEAYAAYRQALQLASAKRDDRARELAAALQSLLETPHVRLALPDPIPPGLELRVDDQRVPSEMLETETVVFTKPVNTHAVVVNAPGYETWRANIDSKAALKVVDLHRSTPPDATPAQTGSSEQWPWQAYAGLGLGVAGLAMVGVGLVAGVSWLHDYNNQSSSLENEFNGEACDNKQAHGLPVCTQDIINQQVGTKNKYDDTVSTGRLHLALDAGILLAGGVMVVGGTYWFLQSTTTRERASPARGSLSILPAFDASRAGIVARGIF